MDNIKFSLTITSDNEDNLGEYLRAFDYKFAIEEIFKTLRDEIKYNNGLIVDDSMFLSVENVNKLHYQFLEELRKKFITSLESYDLKLD